MARKINRYAQKRKHKRRLKQKYARGLYTRYRENLKLHEAECRERYGDWKNARNGGYEYWQSCYLTGPRRFAKNCTNRVIRAMYREILNSLAEDDIDDISAFHDADYRKTFDYDWTIW